MLIIAKPDTSITDILPLRWYAMYTSADLLELRNGYLGLKFPVAVMALVMASAAVCSMYPSMGRLAAGMGAFLGGSLWGSFRLQYFSGNRMNFSSLSSDSK